MGIIIAAIITTLVALVGAGALYRQAADPSLRRVLLIAALVMLPMQPLAFYLVRVPLDSVLASASAFRGHTWPTTFYAPLIEEPAKWLVLLVPFVRRALTPKTAVPLALATGFGFGVGEIWFLAEQLTRAPAFADIPFYMFTGFFYERLIVIFLHGAFVMFAFQRLAEGRSFWIGGMIGMTLHWLLNLPIFLSVLAAFGLPAEKWRLISLLVQVVMVWWLAVVAWRLFRDAREGDKLGTA